MKQPTPIQLEYVEAIETFWIENGSAPTQLELCDLVGRTSSSVRYMLGRLEDKGLILPLVGKWRSIRTTRMGILITIGQWPGEKE